MENFCFQCGECCKTLFKGMIVTKEEIQLIQKLAGVKLNYQQVRTNRFQLFGNCPFFLEDTQLCSIYEIRPCQCRLYHCGRLKPSDKKLETIPEIRQLMLSNPEYKRFKEKMDKEATEWGNKHGWNWRKINADNMVSP